MRVLLDECLPRKLKQNVRADFVRTVPEMGWASIENGALLRLAEPEFDVFLTRDRIWNTNRTWGRSTWQ
jgi:hypothetical protein